jgi:hypothetical protein
MVRKARWFALGLVLYIGYSIILLPERLKQYFGMK